MISLRRVAAALCLTACALPAQAETFDLNLNGDAFRVALEGPTDRLFQGTSGEYQVGGIFSDDSGDDIGTGFAGLLLTGDTGAQDVKLTGGLGVRAQFTSLDQDDGGGLAVGGELDLRFPGFDRLGLQGYVYYQPEVLSLGDIEDQLEYAVAVDYQLLRNASLYLGYRQLEVDPEHGGRFTADDGAHFGLRLQF